MTSVADRTKVPIALRKGVRVNGTEYEPTIHGIDKRLYRLEIEYKSQDRRLAEINSNLSKLVWIVLTGVLVAVLSQIIPVI